MARSPLTEEVQQLAGEERVGAALESEQLRLPGC